MPYLVLEDCDLTMNRLFPKEPQEKGYENRENYAGNKGKIEGEIIPFYINITWKPANPRNFTGKGNNNANYCDYEAKDNKSFT